MGDGERTTPISSSLPRRSCVPLEGELGAALGAWLAARGPLAGAGRGMLACFSFSFLVCHLGEEC